MGWEAKTGFFAQRSSSQVAKDQEIEKNGGIIASHGALAGELRYGSNIRYPTGVISILNLEE